MVNSKFDVKLTVVVGKTLRNLFQINLLLFFSAHYWTSDSDSDSVSVRDLELELNANTSGPPTSARQGERNSVARTREFKMPKILELCFDSIWYGFMVACFGVGLMSFLRPDAADKISSMKKSIL